MKGKIRLASAADAEALLAIYAPYVKNTCISFEYEVPTLEQFTNRIRDISAEYPYLVYEDEGQLLGYTYAHRYLERAAYSWDVEVTIYLSQQARGRGIGRVLYLALERLLTLQRVKSLYACVTGNNVHSIGFHKTLGYSLLGTFPKSGFKQGQWLDIVWMEKLIGSKQQSPLPFIPFSKLELAQVADNLQLINKD